VSPGRRRRGQSEAQRFCRRALTRIRGWWRPRIIAAASVALLATVGTTSGLLLWASSDSDEPRAVIVDQLSFTDPNPEFLDRATSMLEAAGYDVDYVPPEQVTVDFYRDLPRHGYDVIVVRSHSSQLRQRRRPVVLSGPTPTLAESVVTESVVAMFTNEPYSRTAHVDEQRAEQLSVASYPERPERGPFFGVTLEFVQGEMRGNFGGATFILMGCGGLSSTGMAQALVDRGVGKFISWDDEVTATHTDRATEQLLRHLLADQRDPEKAIAQTMAEVGRDPHFGSQLLVFP